jgi:hypothetical protein
MSNQTSLCTSDQPLIYPSLAEDSYDYRQQTIACQSYAVPLTWLMLFREADILEQQIPQDGDTITRSAPVVGVEVALSRLPQSVASFASAFPQQRSLQGYADMMTIALSSARRFETIELSELEDMGLEIFRPLFRHCLRGFEDPRCWIPNPGIPGAPEQFYWPDSLLQITSLQFDTVFPPADMFLSGGDYADEDYSNHGHLFGEGICRPVPWEPKRA